MGDEEKAWKEEDCETHVVAKDDVGAREDTNQRRRKKESCWITVSTSSSLYLAKFVGDALKRYIVQYK